MLSDNPKICSGSGHALRAESVRSSRPTPAVALLAVAALLPACATQVPQRESLSGHGRTPECGQAGSWESVMSTPEVAERLGDFDAAQLPEFARADGRLSIDANNPILASDAWPQPYRADLDTPRQLYIRDRNGTFTFFGVRRRYDWSYDGYRRGYGETWTGWGGVSR